ncbi:MAG TPA: universal stress protein [Solirubrobacteraceae bacterium]|jgi:nucleotide-binding universal stress UspA family protein|nr:universal stress protein [Solirubrobacteraceae bacterium]
MFDSVLVGVDGSANGRDAIALAARLAGTQGKLMLAHVHRGEVAEELRDSHELLERDRANAGVQAELISVVASAPGRGLHQQAEQLHADLLVVGSCSRGALGRAMLGDDTRAALNGASCAVAVAPVGYAAHAAPFATVGVAYNGSPESIAALAAAREIAAPTQARIRALEVISVPSVAYTGIVPAALGESIDVLLDQARSRMAELADVEGSAVYGLAGEELAKLGEDVDLLVVGSRGYGPVRRLVLGSTSEYLQRHARCPLLVLPRMQAGSPDASHSDVEAQEPAAALAGSSAAASDAA